MPPLSDQDDEVEVPKAPRSQEEFDVLAWGRDDFIPGLGFGCAPVFDTCEFTPGHGHTVGRDTDTGLPLYVLGEYTYMNTGPSTGVLTFRDDIGGSYTFTLEFGGSGSMRVTIETPDGGASVWPGTPHLDLTLGAQPMLLPIPPSWSSAIAIQTDLAPEDWEDWYRDWYSRHSLPADWEPVLFGDVYDRLVAGPKNGLKYLQASKYEKIGRNRATITVRFEKTRSDQDDAYENLDEFQRDIFDSTWVFDLSFTSDGAARFTLTVTREGYLPTVVEGVVDFHGDGISVDEFPEELRLPDDPPQASGEDVAGVEVAAAVSATSIGSNDLQVLLVSDTGTEHQPGDWLEPKDGSNQRMMIVGAGQSASALAFEAPAPAPRSQRSPNPSGEDLNSRPAGRWAGGRGRGEPADYDHRRWRAFVRCGHDRFDRRVVSTRWQLPEDARRLPTGSVIRTCDGRCASFGYGRARGRLQFRLYPTHGRLHADRAGHTDSRCPVLLPGQGRGGRGPVVPEGLCVERDQQHTRLCLGLRS